MAGIRKSMSRPKEWNGGSMPSMASSSRSPRDFIAESMSAITLRWVSGTVFGRFSEPLVNRIAAYFVGFAL